MKKTVLIIVVGLALGGCANQSTIEIEEVSSAQMTVTKKMIQEVNKRREAYIREHQ